MDIRDTFEEIRSASPERFAEIKAELMAQTERIYREKATLTRDLQNVLVTNLRKTNSILIAITDGKKFDPKELKLQIASNHGVIGKLHENGN